MSDFFDAIRRFLLDYLPKQRCLSKNTILSYRQTLNIFVAYMRDEIGIGAAELTFSRVDRDVILNFLTWLEKARGCSVSTRNQRLMALRSFLDFAGQIDCTQTSLYLSACNIPSKEAHGRIVEFLTEPALTALLQQPNPSRQKDQRNLVWQSGLRNPKTCWTGSKRHQRKSRRGKSRSADHTLQMEPPRRGWLLPFQRCCPL